MHIMNEQADVIIVIFQVEKIFFIKPSVAGPGTAIAVKSPGRYLSERHAGRPPRNLRDTFLSTSNSRSADWKFYGNILLS